MIQPQPAWFSFPDLIRPWFYPGQVLSDRDLNCLVDWIQKRAALSRLRGGWGIVCGLEPSVGRDASTITVSPGYAVDPWGNDLVLPELDSLPLPKVTKGEVQECMKLSKGEKSTDTVSFGPFTFLKEETAVFLLQASLKIDEKLKVEADSKAPSASQHKFSRMRDSVEFHLKPVKRPSPFVPPERIPDAAAVDFLHKFRDKFPMLFTINYSILENQTAIKLESPPADDLQKWLSEHLQAFPNIRRLLPGLKIDEMVSGMTTPWGAAREMFWMVNALRRPEQTCPIVSGRYVPLAKVWAVRTGRTFEVKYFETASPVRRMYAMDALPDALDVRAAIGKRVEDLPIQVTHQTFEIPASAADLLAILEKEAEIGSKWSTSEKYCAMLNGQGEDASIVAFKKGPVKTLFDKPSSSVDVEVYFPSGNAETGPICTSASDLNGELKLTAIPWGTLISVAVRFEKHKPVTTDMDYFLYEELSGTIRKVESLASLASDWPIVTQVKIPQKKVFAKPPAFVVIAKGKDGTSTTLEGRLPIPVGRETPSTIEIAFIQEQFKMDGVDLKNQTILKFANVGAYRKVSGVLKCKNPLGFEIQGTLKITPDASIPVQPLLTISETGLEHKFEVELDAEKLTLRAALDSTPEFWYPIGTSTVFTEFLDREVPLEAEVKKVTIDEQTLKTSLKLTNRDESKKCKILEVTTIPPRSGNEALPFDLEPNETNATLTLRNNHDMAQWRVIVKFQFDGADEQTVVAELSAS